MQSNCCISVVKEELSKLGLQYKSVELGIAEIKDTISDEKLHLLDTLLNNVGLEIITDNKTGIILKVKEAIHELVYMTDDQPKIKFSDFISSRVNHDYTYLSHLFSTMLGTTVEKYIINEKIERIKNLLVYEELSLNEISYKLKYTSVAHLSNQFKRVTGMTPSSYRGLMFPRPEKKELE
jgi:AraC-like DNA-binding protein